MVQTISCPFCFHRFSTRQIPVHADQARLCPQCRAELPYDAGLIDQYNIAIIGARAAGRTHYIASLLHRLQYETGKQLGFTIRMQDEYTRQRWEHDFYTPLFLKRTILQPSPLNNEQIQAPLTLRFTFTQGRVQRILNISIFDLLAAEAPLPTMISRQNSLIKLAQGIILLLDPLQIPAIRRLITTTTLPPLDPQATPENIVKHLHALFEQKQHLQHIRKIKIPLALTLSKIDMLLPLLEPGSELHHPSEHSGYIDLNDVQSVHTEIEKYLPSWVSPRFNHFINDNIAHYSYFGISALGEQPGNDNLISSISPLRVEDPFLWILYQLKLVPGMHML